MRNKDLHLEVRPQGHVAFRILSGISTAKAVIGPNGVVQQRIIRETGAWRLRVEDALPNCEDRVVHVIGASSVDRTLSLLYDGGVRNFEVSAAQLAVVRVYEAIEAAAVRKCRLLVVSGSEVRKRVDELNKIEKESGAFVRVLSRSELPLCAHLSDELIQMTGASLAVKKALIAVTHCLQEKWNKSSSSQASTSSGPSCDLLLRKNPCYVKELRGSGQSRISDEDTREVVFRLICPAYPSGGLNGWEASKETAIKNLERKTGASILVSPPMPGCDDLVITVSAMENKDWKYSPAQNAAACIFIGTLEDDARDGNASGGASGMPVTAKLLTSFNQIHGVDLTSKMENTEVQILDDNQYASADEKIIQIVGELSDVHVCLFQVTWHLREKMFSSKLIMENGPRLPHEILGWPPCNNQTSGIAEAMDELAITDGMNDHLKSKLSTGDPLTVTTENQAGCDVSTGSGSELGSEDGITYIRNTEVEIVIPANVFGRVYGKDGCNMARVRQITGATVIIHDPSPGTDGSAIISGKPNRTQVAMSMLWAFINEK